MASVSSIKPFLKKFLTDNFKPLFSSNELGALGNIMTDKQLKDEFEMTLGFTTTSTTIIDIGLL